MGETRRDTKPSPPPPPPGEDPNTAPLELSSSQTTSTTSRSRIFREAAWKRFLSPGPSLHLSTSPPSPPGTRRPLVMRSNNAALHLTLSSLVSAPTGIRL
eukprot:4895246-Pyramimonas_sp.AAC.1